jgi:plasmid stabilization system protein ParE
VKPVIPRVAARAHVEAALDYYLREAGETVALRFVAALEQGYKAIAARPASGSPRLAHELDLAFVAAEQGAFPTSSSMWSSAIISPSGACCTPGVTSPAG